MRVLTNYPATPRTNDPGLDTPNDAALFGRPGRQDLSRPLWIPKHTETIPKTQQPAMWPYEPLQNPGAPFFHAPNIRCNPNLRRRRSALAFLADCRWVFSLGRSQGFPETYEDSGFIYKFCYVGTCI